MSALPALHFLLIVHVARAYRLDQPVSDPARRVLRVLDVGMLGCGLTTFAAWFRPDLDLESIAAAWGHAAAEAANRRIH